MVSFDIEHFATVVSQHCCVDKEGKAFGSTRLLSLKNSMVGLTLIKHLPHVLLQDLPQE